MTEIFFKKIISHIYLIACIGASRLVKNIYANLDIEDDESPVWQWLK